MGSEIKTALGEHGRTVGKLNGIAYDFDIAIHIFVRPASRMGDIRELWKYKSELREETQHLTGNRLNIILSADNNKSGDFVTYENLIANRYRILHAIEALSHFEIEGRSGTPSYWRRYDDGVSPMHQGFIDLIHLIVGIHLRD